jgi:hypothetical protein
MYHDLECWEFADEHCDTVNARLVNVFGWSAFSAPDGSPPTGPLDASMLVFVQPPWILSPRDIASFCECKSVCVNVLLSYLSSDLLLAIDAHERRLENSEQNKAVGICALHCILLFLCFKPGI